MAPPGRRRATLPSLSLLIISLLFLSQSVAAVSAVLGIDLGTEYIKAVLVKPGTPLEIVLSKDSKRKEPSVVSFKTPKSNAVAKGVFPERFYGSAAQALSARFPGDAYFNLKQLLGLPQDTSTVVKEYKARYPAVELVTYNKRGTTAFKSKSFESHETPFPVEELLAMVLKNVVSNAQTMTGKAYKVSNVVFTIPPFSTIEEKSALELAANLAGLKVLGVVSDGLAVGINYATSRKFESINDGAKPEYHMIYDVGAGYTTATILKMQGRTVKDVGKFNKTVQEVIVMGTGWDRTLGGDALNHVIIQDMATKFIESSAGKKLGKTAADVLADGRASARLWKDAEKVRQVLSANQQTQASWEELYQDVDFKYKLARGDFEKQAEPFAERLAAPFASALKAANLTAADLDSVILHGGAIRTPLIQKHLEGLVGDSSKLRSNVNSDEAAAFGAAFKAASISPSFRVKEIRAYDSAVYPTWIQYKKKDGKTTQQKIFTSSSHVGASKVVTLPHQEDFEIYVFQKRPTDAGSPFESGAQGNSGSTFKSTKLNDAIAKLTKDFSCKPEDISTKVTLRLDPVWGLPEVSGGTVSCDREVAEKEPGVMDNVKDFLGFGKKGDGSQKPLKDDKKDSSSSASSSEKSSSSSSSSSAAAKSSAKDAKDAKDAKPAKTTIKTETVKFDFNAEHDDSTTVPFVEQKFINERLRLFGVSDKERITREEDLNNLEGFTYKARDLLTDESFTGFASKPMLKDIEDLIKATSSWVSEEGFTAASDILKEKLKALHALVDPIRRRKDEAEKRPQLTTTLREALSQAQSFIKIIEESIESSAKSASSAAAEASKSVEDGASSVTSAIKGETTDGGLESLEEDESSSSSTKSATTTAIPEPFMPQYTAEDLSELAGSYKTVEEWLEKKLKEQDALKPWEEPVFDSKEISSKATDLNNALMKILTKKMKPPPKPKSKSKSAKKAAKSKTDEAKSKATDAASKATDTASKATDKIKEEVSTPTDKAKEAAETVKSKASDVKDEL
ncbi:actin-like ATPase domain-containing protein [Microthyrium microscopicum]|uniref:Actin-like ATPase domain-containing protein n=1 Tax=Microthyrium microscopicum TaxID=703497 RepID=A0A6A6TX47_9PEZI|nr:actin-like ATPase domain-containing protein [Microthyrium microscopicum]